MARVVPKPPPWVKAATAQEGAGFEYIPGGLEKNEWFLLRVTLRPETSMAQMEAYIVDGPPEAQLDLLNNVYEVIDTMINALRAQISKEG